MVRLIEEAYSEATKSWVQPIQLLPSCSPPDSERGYKLPLGGFLRVRQRYVDVIKAKRIMIELQKSDQFRQYNIRSTPEPRAQMLLHEDATADFDQPQPGYDYARIKMKARPLNNFPMVKALAEKSAADLLIRKRKWDIGAHIVFFRDGQENMGAHSDDDQGEQCIHIFF
jgi:hypothetical protein